MGRGSWVRMKGGSIWLASDLTSWMYVLSLQISYWLGEMEWCRFR